MKLDDCLNHPDCRLSQGVKDSIHKQHRQMVEKGGVSHDEAAKKVVGEFIRATIASRNALALGVAQVEKDRKALAAKKVDTAPPKVETPPNEQAPAAPEPAQEGQGLAGPPQQHGGAATIAARIAAAHSAVPRAGRESSVRARPITEAALEAQLGPLVYNKLRADLAQSSGIAVQLLPDGSPALVFDPVRLQQQLDEYEAEGYNSQQVLETWLSEENDHVITTIVGGFKARQNQRDILAEFSQDPAARAALDALYPTTNEANLGAELIRIIRQLRLGMTISESFTRPEQLFAFMPFVQRAQGPLMEAHLKRMAEWVAADIAAETPAPAPPTPAPTPAPVPPGPAPPQAPAPAPPVAATPEPPAPAPAPAPAPEPVSNIPRKPVGVSDEEVAQAENQDMVQGTGERAHQTLKLADGTLVPFTYSVVDGRLVVDNPENERPGPEHPETQEFVAKNSGKNFDDRKPFVEDPDFQKGPAVAEHREGRYVLNGGHRRTYIYRNNRAAYETALMRDAFKFGIDPAIVQTMLDSGAEPYLIALIDEPLTPEQRTSLVRTLNTVDQQAVNPIFEAVSAGRVLTKDSIDEASALFENAGNVTPLAALKSESAKALSAAFLRDGAIRSTDQAKYVQPTGIFTDEGAKFARLALLGRVVDSPQVLQWIDGTPAETKLLNAIGQLHVLEDRGQDMDVFRKMLELEASRLESGVNTEKFYALRDQDFLLQRDPPIEALHRWFNKFSSRDSRATFNKLINEFAPVEKGGTSMFGETNRDIAQGLLAKEGGDALMAQPKRKLSEDEAIYRALRKKQDSGKKLTPQEHDRMLAIELSLGQKLIIPMTPRNPSDLDLYAPKEPAPSPPVETDLFGASAEPETKGPKKAPTAAPTGQQEEFLMASEEQAGQLTMFAQPYRGRNAELQKAASDLKAGTITREQYDQAVDRLKPVKSVKELPAPPSDEVMREALGTKGDKVGAARSLPAGHAVGVRIDIPAFKRTGKYVLTVHEGAKGARVGPVIGYDSIAKVDNPRFHVTSQALSQRIATGETAKAPLATVEGKYDPDRSIPEGMVGWTQAGYDPERHGYFYDKESGRMIVSGKKAVMLGNTAFVQEPVYSNAHMEAMYALPKRPTLTRERGKEAEFDASPVQTFSTQLKQYRADLETWAKEHFGTKPMAFAAPEDPKVIRLVTKDTYPQKEGGNLWRTSWFYDFGAAQIPERKSWNGQILEGWTPSGHDAFSTLGEALDTVIGQRQDRSVPTDVMFAQPKGAKVGPNDIQLPGFDEPGELNWGPGLDGGDYIGKTHDKLEYLVRHDPQILGYTAYFKEEDGSYTVLAKPEPTLKLAKRIAESHLASKRADDAGKPIRRASYKLEGPQSIAAGEQTEMTLRPKRPPLPAGFKPSPVQLKMTRAGMTQTSPVDYLPEWMTRVLKPHQARGANLALHAFSRGLGFLNGDGTGAGKTMQAIAVASVQATKGDRVLVVTENDTIIQNAFAKDSEILGAEMWRYMGDEVVPGRVYAATYHNVRTGLVQAGDFDTVIFDEAHNLRNVLQETKQAQAGMLLAKNARHVMYATATPLDKPEQIFYLRPILGDSISGYFDRLGIIQREHVNKKTGEVTTTFETSDKISDAQQEAVMDEILSEITRRGQMIKRDVPLNNVTVQFKEVKISDAAYDEADARYDEIYNEMYDKSPFHAGGVAGMVVRGMLEREKLDETVADALKAISEKKQVIIFAERIEEGTPDTYTEGLRGTLNDLVDRLEEKLGKGMVGKVFGGNRSRSAKDISRFQNSDIHVVVATPASGGTGINLDDIFGDTPRHLIVMTAPMSGLSLVQIIGRINRLTTLSKGSATVMFVEHPVDTWGMDISAAKLATLSASVSGDLTKIKPVTERTTELVLNDNIVLLSDHEGITEDQARAKLTSKTESVREKAEGQVKEIRARLAAEATERRRTAFTMSEDKMVQLADDPDAFSALSTGHAHMQRALLNYVANSTLTEEHAALIRAVFSQVKGDFIQRIIFESNKKMGALGRGGRRGASPLIILKEGKSSTHNPFVSSDMGKVFFHEYGHAGYFTLLTPTERRLVNRVYARMGGRRGVADYFASVSPQPSHSNKRYYAKNVYEFFAQGFAEYVYEKRVPSPLLKRMYDNLLSTLKKFYNALRRRSESGMKDLAPLFDKILDLKKEATEIDFSYPERESVVAKPQGFTKGPVTTVKVGGSHPATEPEKAFLATVETETPAGRSKGWLERYYRGKQESHGQVKGSVPPPSKPATAGEGEDLTLHAQAKRPAGESLVASLEKSKRADIPMFIEDRQKIAARIRNEKSLGQNVKVSASSVKVGETIYYVDEHGYEQTGVVERAEGGGPRTTWWVRGNQNPITLTLITAPLPGGKTIEEAIRTTPPDIDPRVPPPAEGRYRALPPLDQINLNDVPDDLKGLAKVMRAQYNTDRGDKNRGAILQHMRKMWDGYRYWPLPITVDEFLARYGNDWDGHAVNRELTLAQRGMARRSILNISGANDMLDLYLSRRKNRGLPFSKGEKGMMSKKEAGALISSLGHLLKADELPPAAQLYTLADEGGQMAMFAQGRKVASFKSGANTDALLDAYTNIGDNIGVELGDLTAKRGKKLTDYLNSGRGQVFVDSGAFRAFQSGKALDFDSVMTDYRQIVDSIDQPYRGNLSLVMPDVIGDQDATMKLVKTHKDEITGLIKDGARVIMPMQLGAPLSETHAQYAKILGTDSFVPGIPSKAEAFPKGEVVKFIRAEKPREIHLLGMNDNPKNAAYLKLIEAVSPETRVTMDGTWHRAKVGEGRPITETRRNILSHLADDTEMTGSLFLDNWAPEGKHLKTLADIFKTTPEELQKAARAGKLGEKLEELSGHDDLVHLRIKEFTDRLTAAEHGPDATRQAVEHVSRIDPADQSVDEGAMFALPKAVRALMPFITAGQNIKEGVQKLVLPSAISDEHLEAANELRARLGPMHRRQEVARSVITPIKRGFERLGVNKAGPLDTNPGVEFMSNMSTGRPQATPELQATESVFEALLGERIKDLAATGAPLSQVRANYFPGMWSLESRRAFNQALSELVPTFGAGWTIDTATPAQTKAVKDRVDELLEKGLGIDKDMFSYFTRNPLKGPERFRKKKVFDDIMTGVDFGLRPISNNPADLIMGKLAELDRSIMANEYFDDLKANGKLRVIPPTRTPPDGWVELPDRYGTVYAPPTPSIYGLRIVGKRIVPKEVGDVVKNYLSSSLYNNQYFGSIFAGWMGVANMLNQAQLGVGSAFHAGFTTVEAQISGVANLLKDAYGVMRGNRNLGQFIKTVGQTMIASVETAATGAKVLKGWNDPTATMSNDVRNVVRAAELAGAGFKLEKGLSTTQLEKQYSDWFSGHKVRAAMRSPVAFVELLAKPIMEMLVPVQKAGVFAHMVKRIIEQNPGVHMTDLAPEFSSAWNRIDARLGQVRYDRLFLNNVAKNVVQSMIRAPGWSGGTIAEIAGGAKDTAKFFAEWAKTGSLPKDIPDRVAYTTALILTVGTLNALLTVLFTGRRPEGDDYWAFRTGREDESGNPERFTLPSYMKDIYAYWKDAGATITHKMHPLLSLFGEMITNKDYYNVNIRDEEASYAKQAQQAGMHFAKAFIPFWMRGYAKAAERGKGVSERVLPLIGVMPAPRQMNQSPAVAYGEKYWAGTRTEAGVSPAKFESQQAKRGLVREIRAGKTPNITGALKSGTLKPADIKPLYSRARLGAFPSMVLHMPLEQAEATYKLASPTEKAQIAGIMASKRKNAIKRSRTPFKGF